MRESHAMVQISLCFRGTFRQFTLHPGRRWTNSTSVLRGERESRRSDEEEGIKEEERKRRKEREKEKK